MKRILVSGLCSVALLGMTANAAEAGTPSPIPSAWGGGSAVVDLPDFTYPAPNGCYINAGTLSLPGNNPYGWDYFVADLTVTDSIGRVKDYFSEFEDGYTTSIPLSQQLCYSLDAPGTYTVTGTIEFNDYPYSYTVPVSDSYTITGYTAPAVAAPVVATPAPAVNNKCVKAKKALKKAKKQNKPFKAVQAAKKKVKKVC